MYAGDGAAGATTAERADVFVRRQAAWARLMEVFKDDRPTEEQLTTVSMLAEVAIDQVFSAHQLTEAQQFLKHPDVKDYAECATLYGYVMGLYHGRREAMQRAVELAG